MLAVGMTVLLVVSGALAGILVGVALTVTVGAIADRRTRSAQCVNRAGWQPQLGAAVGPNEAADCAQAWLDNGWKERFG